MSIKPEDFINDADYVVKPQVNFKREYCPFYTKWAEMKRRVTSEAYKAKNKTYANTTCCEEWLVFSNFKKWMEQQPWEGMELDKDILDKESNTYSPETSRFVPHKINSLFRQWDKSKKGNGGVVGTHYIKARPEQKNKKRWFSQVSTATGGQKYLGVYHTQMEAHQAWQLAMAAELELIVDWWRVDATVRHSFQEDVAASMLDRAGKLRHDHRHSRITQWY